MGRILRFPTAAGRDPGVAAWLREHDGPLGDLARHWYAVMRECGDDVRELLHDGQPTACVGDAAFAYVDAFTHHVNVGFFLGAYLDDPQRLLQGTGKFMRHVKLRPHVAIDEAALQDLIRAAYDDMQQRTDPVVDPTDDA